jgi:hypothetical protein
VGACAGALAAADAFGRIIQHLDAHETQLLLCDSLGGASLDHRTKGGTVAFGFFENGDSFAFVVVVFHMFLRLLFVFGWCEAFASHV